MTKYLRLLLVLVAVLALVPTAFANHWWGGYHWARQSNPFTLKAHDTVTAVWEPYLQEAADDWNGSTILTIAVQWGQPLSNAKRCASAAGRIEVCNSKYGNTGWLGIAGISITGGEHITKAYTKLNDTYFNTASYNTPAWRRLVTCQEIAHDFGLDHQDENFDNANLGSCMDYTSDPDGGAGGGSSNDPSNEHPNAHDYDQIETIYSHLDSTTTISALDSWTDSLRVPPSDESLNADVQDWGMPVRWNAMGQPTVFAKPSADHDGHHGVDLTHVFWAPFDPFDGSTGARGLEIGREH